MIADIPLPGWSPFSSFTLTEDLRSFIEVHKELLKFDFDRFVGGHPMLGERRDVHRSLQFVREVIQGATDATAPLTPQQLGKAGIGKVADPNAVEYGNFWLVPLGVVRRLETEGCYRSVLEKWGYRLGGIDLTLQSHCFAAVLFNVLPA